MYCCSVFALTVECSSATLGFAANYLSLKGNTKKGCPNALITKSQAGFSLQEDAMRVETFYAPIIGSSDVFWGINE